MEAITNASRANAPTSVSCVFRFCRIRVEEVRHRPDVRDRLLGVHAPDGFPDRLRRRSTVHRRPATVVSSAALICMAIWTWPQIDQLVSVFEQRYFFGTGRLAAGRRAGRGGGGGLYSTSTLLMMAIGRPVALKVSVLSGRTTDSFSPRM